jgi:small-conductance mechanosensitive channel
MGATTGSRPAGSSAHAGRSAGIWLAASLACVLTGGRVAAAPPPEEKAPPAAAAAEPADLVISNRVVFTFRAEYIGYSPAARARAARERIEAILDGGEGGEVGVTPLENGAALTIGKKLAFAITPGDVDLLGEQTLDQASASAARNLAIAVSEATELRRPGLLLRAVVAAAVATAAFVAVLLGLRRLHRLLGRWLEAKATARAEKLVFHGFAPLSAANLRAAAHWAVRVATWGAGLFACYLWLTYALERFPYTRPWGEHLGGFLVRTFATIGAAAVSSLPGIAMVLVILLLARALVGLVNAIFRGIGEGRIEVSEAVRETAQPTRKIAVAVLWLFAIVMAYPYLPGSGSEAFKGVSVFLGLMATFGGSSLFGQAVSGLVLMYSRSLRPGDYVRVNEYEGTVTSLGTLATKIRTPKDEEISVPNSVLVGTATMNFSRLAGRRGVILYTSVTIGYDTPWRQVHAMLIMAAERTAGLRGDPPPFVWQTALSDYYVEYQLNAHLDRPEERQPTLAALHTNIQDVFNEFGVQIMSPHFMANPPEKVWVPRERWHEPPAEPQAEKGQTR